MASVGATIVRREMRKAATETPTPIITWDEFISLRAACQRYDISMFLVSRIKLT